MNPENAHILQDHFLPITFSLTSATYPSQKEKFVRQILQLDLKFPDLFFLSKWIGETLLLQEGKNLPLYVIRPCMIGCAYVDFSTAWMADEKPTFSSLLMTGCLLDEFFMASEYHYLINMIPVECVVDAMLLGALHGARHPLLNIHSCQPSRWNPCRWNEVVHCLREFRRAAVSLLPLKDSLEKTMWHKLIKEGYGFSQYATYSSQSSPTSVSTRAPRLQDGLLHVFQLLRPLISRRFQKSPCFYVDIPEVMSIATMPPSGWHFKRWIGVDLQWAINMPIISSPSPHSINHQALLNKMLTDARNQLYFFSTAYTPTGLRFLAWFFRKVFKSLFDHIFVDVMAISKLQELIKRHDVPLLLLPTHRSYMDFLLLSYVCFAFHLRPPCIVADELFMRLPFVSFFLKRGGAFFIQRNMHSADSSLYKELFKSYFKHLLPHHGMVEFFIEGTRTRSGL
ncbi:naD-binding domain 4 domain-containing protein, partial [Cardiosporidium cionae]